MIARKLIFGFISLFALAAAVSCGGSDALTLEEYFEELEQIDADFEERSEDIDTEFEDVTSDPSADLDDDQRDEIVDLLERTQDAIQTFADDIDGLNPPEEVEDLHEEAVSLFNDIADTFDGLIADAEDADTIEDVFAGFEDLEADFADADDLCLEFEEVAADNDIDVDLNCDDGATDGEDDEPAPDDEDEPTPDDQDEPTPDDEDDNGDTGDGNPELESYLEEYNAISGDFAAEAETRSSQFTTEVEGVTDPDELSSLLDGFLSDFGDLLDDIIADLEDLDPPDEAADLHDAQIAKLDEARGIVTDARDRLVDATTVNEIGVIAQEFGGALIDLGEELSQDCVELQAVADDEGVDIDLNCE
jgi:hypothetical protein